MWNEFFYGQISFLTPKQQCQSTERKSRHWSQSVAWPHPVFIHQRISGRRAL